jgi:hypothetical protein
MSEDVDSEIEGIGHYILHSQNGIRFMRIECPICEVWVDGPLLIEEGNVHLFETWPVDSHKIVEIAAGWQKRLQGKAEIPIEKVHIHIQAANLSIYPDWKPAGMGQYFRLGKPITEPRDFVEGRL